MSWLRNAKYLWSTGKIELVHASFDKLVTSCRIIAAFTHSTLVLLSTFLSHSLVNTCLQLATSYLWKKRIFKSEPVFFP
jgi:hypothetical protein